MRVISTKLEEHQVHHLDVLAAKLRTTTSAIVRSWILNGFEHNPITEEDEHAFANQKAVGIAGLIPPHVAQAMPRVETSRGADSIGYEEITRRLVARGFTLVDSVRGLEGDIKWRTVKAPGKGSLWVKDNCVHATGAYERALGPGLSDRHRPPGCVCHYPVWTGRQEIEALLNAIERRWAG